MKKKIRLNGLQIESFITSAESELIKGAGIPSYGCLTNNCGLPVSYSCLGPCQTFECPPPASTSPGCNV